MDTGSQEITFADVVARVGELEGRIADALRGSGEVRVVRTSSVGRALIAGAIAGLLAWVGYTYHALSGISVSLARIEGQAAAIGATVAKLDASYRRAGARADATDLLLVADCVQQNFYWHARREFGSVEENERCADRLKALHERLQARIDTE